MTYDELNSRLRHAALNRPEFVGDTEDDQDFGAMMLGNVMTAAVMPNPPCTGDDVGAVTDWEAELLEAEAERLAMLPEVRQFDGTPDEFCALVREALVIPERVRVG